MYRLLERLLTAQRTADARQEQPPTKRETGRESLQQARWKQPPSTSDLGGQ